jgi:hypothetical protein
MYPHLINCFSLWEKYVVPDGWPSGKSSLITGSVDTRLSKSFNEGFNPLGFESGEGRVYFKLSVVSSGGLSWRFSPIGFHWSRISPKEPFQKKKEKYVVHMHVCIYTVNGTSLRAPNFLGLWLIAHLTHSQGRLRT